MIFIKNLASVYTVYVVNGILGIITIPLFTNNLGLSAYGLYSLYITLVSYMSLIELGITKNLTRTLAFEKDERKKAEQFQIVSGYYVIIILLLIILLPFLTQILTKWFSYGGEFQDALTWVAILSVAEYILGFPTTLLQANCIANEKFLSYSKFSFASGLTRYALLLLGILLFSNPVYIILLLVIRKVIDFVFAYKIIGGLPRKYWRPIFDITKLRDLLSQSVLLSVTQALQITIVSIGSILIGRYFGIEKLGLYRSIFDLVSKVWFFSNVLGLVSFPRFAKILHNPTENLQTINRIPHYLNLSWTLYSLVGFIGIFLSPYILRIFNYPNVDVSELFSLLLVGVILNAHANLSYEYLQADGRYVQTLKLSLLTVVILLFGYFGMLKSVGFTSIGWAWMFSMLVYALTADYTILVQIKSYTSIRILPSFLLKLFTIVSCVIYAFNRDSDSSHMIYMLLLPNLLWFGQLLLSLYFFHRRVGDRT
jgi:O-antigen/teichoic acid export membrane protein